MKQFLFVIVALVAAAAYVNSESEVAKRESQTVIENAYINGAFNDLDTTTLRNGFHPTFRIHGVRSGELRQIPINDWIAGIEDRKSKPDFDPADERWGHKIVFIDSTGPAAIAKIELFKDSQHVYTDYLSLLKLSDGWKITDKVYHRHPES